MTKTLVIHHTQRRLNRALGYLALIEKSKARYRKAMADYIRWLNSPDDFHSRYYRKYADRMRVLHPYLLKRYNDCVAESLIITI